MKKIIFESQRQMARTLMDKSSREDHILSKIVESRMLIEQATRQAAKTLRKEEIILRPTTVLAPVLNFKKIPGREEGKKQPETKHQIRRNRKFEESRESSNFRKKLGENNLELSTTKIPSYLITSKMRDLSIENIPQKKPVVLTPSPDKQKDRMYVNNKTESKQVKMKLD